MKLKQDNQKISTFNEYKKLHSKELRQALMSFNEFTTDDEPRQEIKCAIHSTRQESSSSDY